MNGIDGKFALLKMVRADLSVKRKTITEDNNLSEEEKAYLAYGGAKQFAFAELPRYVN